jgi:hypothetical protein
MAIYTLADMHARNQRSSSIPRQYHRLGGAQRQDHRFSVADAVQLKLKLQALDRALSGTFTDQSYEHVMANINEALHLQPPPGTVYVAGSEEFFLIVKSVSRPDLIPSVFAEASEAMLQGRPYVNRYNVSDFKKGVDPTFSEIRRLLPDIDRACETDLDGAVARLEAQGKLRVPSRAYQRCTDMAQSHLFHFCDFQLSSAYMYIRTLCPRSLASFRRRGTAKSRGCALLSCVSTSRCTMKCENISMSG